MRVELARCITHLFGGRYLIPCGWLQPLNWQYYISGSCKRVSSHFANGTGFPHSHEDFSFGWATFFNVVTPPMVGSTWSRVRSTLESDCLPALYQGTTSFRLVVDWLLITFIVAAHIWCLVIWGCTSTYYRSSYIPNLVYAALRAIPTLTCTSTSMVARIPWWTLPYTFGTDSTPPCLLMFHGGSLRFYYWKLLYLVCGTLAIGTIT